MIEEQVSLDEDEDGSREVLMMKNEKPESLCF